MSNSPRVPSLSIPSASSHARLAALGSVGWRDAACLRRQKTWIECTHCHDACPSGAIAVDAGGPRLDPIRCTGCGRCAVECPTEALAVDGFAIACVSAADAALRIVCQRRSDDSHSQATVRVPCLYGLSPQHVLALLGQHPEQSFRINDTHCGGCVLDDGHLRQRVEHWRATLDACGIGRERLELVSQPPLPDGNSATTANPLPARRAFLSGLGRSLSQHAVRQASRSLPLIGPGMQPRQPRHAVPYEAGHRTRLLMQQLAAQAGTRPARAWLPQVEVDARCRAHGACSRLCPTSALRTRRHDHAALLVFDPWLCIDCGACRTACPEGALHYAPPSWRGFEAAPVLLTRVAQSTCERCNAEYAPADPSGRCPSCRKTAAVAAAGFALRSGRRLEHGGPAPP